VVSITVRTRIRRWWYCALRYYFRYHNCLPAYRNCSRINWIGSIAKQHYSVNRMRLLTRHCGQRTGVPDNGWAHNQTYNTTTALSLPTYSLRTRILVTAYSVRTSKTRGRLYYNLLATLSRTNAMDAILGVDFAAFDTVRTPVGTTLGSPPHTLTTAPSLRPYQLSPSYHPLTPPPIPDAPATAPTRAVALARCAHAFLNAAVS